MPDEPRRTVHVYSDGTADETRVTLDDGTDLTKNITSLVLSIEANALNVVELTLKGTPVDIDATINGVEIICSICRHSSSHICGIPEEPPF